MTFSREFEEDHFLLTPQEVGDLFRVDRRTVNKWADRGLLTVIRTLGKQRRYLRGEVEDLLKMQEGRSK